MKNFVCKIAYQTLRILMSVFSVILVFTGIFAVSYCIDMTTQEVLFAPVYRLYGSYITGISVGILLFLLVMLIIIRFAGTHYRAVKSAVLVLSSGWLILCGIALIIFGKTVPAADALSVYGISEALSRGNVSVIDPVNSYISYYPQQAGLVLFFELIFRLWNALHIPYPAYHIIKALYTVLAVLTMLIQFKCAELVLPESSKELSLFCPIFTALNLPFIMYTSFVYGEIPSLFFISLGLFFIIKFLDSAPDASDGNQGKTLYFACSVISVAFAVFVRKNSLIPVIAILLALILTGMHRASVRAFILSAVILICSLSILPASVKFLELRSKSSISSGVTALSYLAMGMQESSRAEGWYNGFNFETYKDTGLDTDMTNKISSAYISGRLKEFRTAPGYAALFYIHKYLSQWADGTYASRQATLADYGGRSPFFKELYSDTRPNSISMSYIIFCKLFQCVVFIGVAVICIKLFFTNNIFAAEGNAFIYRYPFIVCIPLIAAFGGFLFHMVWEANSRYIFAYWCLILPYGAIGCGRLIGIMLAALRRKKDE